MSVMVQCLEAILRITPFFLVPCSPTGIVPCPATPTTFGHIRTANGQGQQRRRITSIQPPTGLQEWLRTFQVNAAEFPFSSHSGPIREPNKTPLEKPMLCSINVHLVLKIIGALLFWPQRISIGTVAWNWNQPYLFQFRSRGSRSHVSSG